MHAFTGKLQGWKHRPVHVIPRGKERVAGGQKGGDLRKQNERKKALISPHDRYPIQTEDLT